MTVDQLKISDRSKEWIGGRAVKRFHRTTNVFRIFHITNTASRFTNTHFSG